MACVLSSGLPVYELVFVHTHRWWQGKCSNHEIACALARWIEEEEAEGSDDDDDSEEPNNEKPEYSSEEEKEGEEEDSMQPPVPCKPQYPRPSYQHALISDEQQQASPCKPQYPRPSYQHALISDEQPSLEDPGSPSQAYLNLSYLYEQRRLRERLLTASGEAYQQAPPAVPTHKADMGVSVPAPYPVYDEDQLNTVAEIVYAPPPVTSLAR